uniref:hypothetical protein n=1 Tax=Paenibacillus sp. GbtcB18 TaxID=2824763 RepID=UPI0020C5DA37
MSGPAYEPGLRLPRLPQGAAEGGKEPPGDAASAEARERLRSGYVPLSFHIRSGEDTFAWYRGSLAPVQPAPYQP